MDLQYGKTRIAAGNEMDNGIWDYAGKAGEPLAIINFQDQEINIELSWEKVSINPGIRYSLELVIDNDDADVEMCFDGWIGEDLLKRTSIALEEMLSGSMKNEYDIFLWGQLQLLLMNQNKKTIEMLIFFDREKVETGSGIYLRIELDEAMTHRMRDALRTVCSKCTENMNRERGK